MLQKDCVTCQQSFWLGIWFCVGRSSGFTSNHRFIATELFRMMQGPHSSGNFDDWTVGIGRLAVKCENLNGCYGRGVAFRLFETVERVAR